MLLGHTVSGAVLSTTFTANEHTLVLPAASEAEHVTVVAAAVKRVPELGVQDVAVTPTLSCAV